jgi:hypothetical protein
VSVSSLNRPGGNLTGMNLMLFAMSGKRLDLLTKSAPRAGAIGLLVKDSEAPAFRRSHAGG